MEERRRGGQRTTGCMYVNTEPPSWSSPGLDICVRCCLLLLFLSSLWLRSYWVGHTTYPHPSSRDATIESAHPSPRPSACNCSHARPACFHIVGTPVHQDGRDAHTSRVHHCRHPLRRHCCGRQGRRGKQEVPERIGRECEALVVARGGPAPVVESEGEAGQSWWRQC